MTEETKEAKPIDLNPDHTAGTVANLLGRHVHGVEVLEPEELAKNIELAVTHLSRLLGRCTMLEGGHRGYFAAKPTIEQAARSQESAEEFLLAANANAKWPDDKPSFDPEDVEDARFAMNAMGGVSLDKLDLPKCFTVVPTKDAEDTRLVQGDDYLFLGEDRQRSSHIHLIHQKTGAFLPMVHTYDLELPSTGGLGSITFRMPAYDDDRGAPIHEVKRTDADEKGA